MIRLNFNLLTTAGATGFLWFLLLFVFTFGLVHIAKLVSLGWKQTQTKPQPNKNENKEQKQKPEEKAPAKPQEPIYYVIERKRKKPKTSYTEPKQITFK